MNKFTATAPNGQVFTRQSKNAYTHAGVLIGSNGEAALVSFSRTYENAHKEASKWVRNWSLWAKTGHDEETRAFYQAKADKWTSFVVVEVEVA